ncbi:MAG TPA: sugar O-acetyltransferase [Candidatus Butyricicoccus stercorigallinarum]|nr:sugar O-acetyltransferase [Candidatus Butyricicoccus stercorigallinarum]
MTAIEKMHSGTLYQCSEPELLREQARRMERLQEFNRTSAAEADKRTALLRELLAEFGEGSYIEPPLYANWSGKHLHLGKHVYANFHLTAVDDTHIYIGDYTQIAPNVTLTTAGHPICPELREQAYQFNLPIHIGRNCWIGAGAIILPGVTIGDNAVIGAGSVVTRDIPPNVVAVGSPCRVLREIGAHDREFYHRDLRIDYGAL